MPLDPDAETLLAMMRAAGRPPMETLTPDEAREAFKAGRAVTQPDPQDVAEVRDLSCPGPHGAIPLRAYRPIGTKADEVLPALVYYHGGGWLLGDLDSHDVACRHYANAAKCRVVSVDYRMAPEYKFPAAVDDCAAATGWVIAQSDALGIDRRRVAVGGDSAGGNLAAVMALMARDGDLPPLVFQLLVYPVTDLGMTHESYGRVTAGVPLTAKTMDWFIDHYLHGPRDRAKELQPWESALLAGIIASPSAYDPVAHPVAATQRRNLVLRNMLQQGRLTRQQYDESIQQPLWSGELDTPRVRTLAPYFTTWVRQQLIDRFGPEKAFEGGLKIKTTLDLDLQNAAQAAVNKYFSYPGGPSPWPRSWRSTTRPAMSARWSAAATTATSPFNLATQGQRQSLDRRSSRSSSPRRCAEGGQVNDLWALSPAATSSCRARRAKSTSSSTTSRAHTRERDRSGRALYVLRQLGLLGRPGIHYGTKKIAKLGAGGWASARRCHTTWR